MSDVPAYYQNPREDLQPLIPSGIRRALDVGCGAGAFGSVLRARGAEVWGIEMVAEMAAVAESRLDRVMVGDAMVLVEELPQAHFDLVSFNDVLEHMAWPDRMLQSVKRVLAPGGHVLASLPNLRHWDALLRLWVDGDFPWEDAGIYDRTHLRFFTEKSARRMFAEGGWEIEQFVGLHPTPSKKLRALNLLTRGKWLDCRFLQYGILARPK